jgi:hypothetical protein
VTRPADLRDYDLMQLFTNLAHEELAADEAVVAALAAGDAVALTVAHAAQDVLGARMRSVLREVTKRSQRSVKINLIVGQWAEEIDDELRDLFDREDEGQ